MTWLSGRVGTGHIPLEVANTNHTSRYYTAVNAMWSCKMLGPFSSWGDWGVNVPIAIHAVYPGHAYDSSTKNIDHCTYIVQNIIKWADCQGAYIMHI